jgi:Zn-dependent protease with chaperone function
LDDLAAGARTAPPTAVYLAPLPTLAVTETGGTFGFGSKRVLLLGAPLLHAVTVEELRAGLAHELGHFAGGDTRLTGVLSYTVATFLSVAESVQRGAFRSGTSHQSIEAGFAVAKALGEALVNGYARLYFLIMRSSSRRQEIAADALAAELGGREAVMRLLEKVTILSPTYEIYVRNEVGFAVGQGAMPADVLEGYERFRARFDSLPIAERLASETREAKTSLYDSHPALGDRLGYLRALGVGKVTADPRPALALLGDEAKVRAWLGDATMNMLEPKQILRRLPWANIPAEVYTPQALERARKLAATLFPLFPDATTLAAMFAAVVGAFEGGRVAEVVTRAAPNVERVLAHERPMLITRIGGSLVGTLFLGALLERGATLDDSLGAPCLLARAEDGELVPAEKIAVDAMRDDGARALLGQWATKLV